MRIGDIWNIRDQQPHVYVVEHHEKYGQPAEHVHAVEPLPTSMEICRMGICDR